MSEKTPEDKKDQDNNDEAPEGTGEKEAPDPDGDDAGEDIRVTKGRKIALMAVALVVVVLGGGGAGYFLGLFDAILDKKSNSRVASIDLGVPVRLELPMIKADLKTGKCRSPLVRTVIVVEIGSKDLPRLEAMQLQIMDAVSTYFRDFERQDMVGKKGSDKFRTDAANIINDLIAPSRIQALIFKEFIIQ